MISRASKPLPESARAHVGPHQGRKVFTLQTLPGIEEPLVDTPDGVAGFSLHASVAVKVNERKKLDRISRHISRPAVSEKRLSLTRQGKVRYQLKTPYRDGTTHVIFEPVDFIAKLAALVPRPRVNLTRYHGVFAPNSTHRALVTPARRGKGGRRNTTQQGQENEQTNRHVAMTWSQRLKRVFNIDVERCRVCGGKARVIAAIEDKAIIDKILAHLRNKASSARTAPLPQVRAPPVADLFR